VVDNIMPLDSSPRRLVW